MSHVLEDFCMEHLTQNSKKHMKTSESTPEINKAQILAIKAEINSGKYRIDTHKIAMKLLNCHAT